MEMDIYLGCVHSNASTNATLISDPMTEGVLTCVVSAALYFLIPDFPEEATWLTTEEKEFVKARLHEDVGKSRRHDPLTPRRVLDVIKDCKDVKTFMNVVL